MKNANVEITSSGQVKEAAFSKSSESSSEGSSDTRSQSDSEKQIKFESNIIQKTFYPIQSGMDIMNII